MADNLFPVLQLCDSAFPTGGFSHSLGSEAAIASSYIRNKDELKRFVIGSLENLGSFSLPFVVAGHQSAGDAARLIELSKVLDASITNHVVKRSSLQQGETLLNSSYESFGFGDLEKLCQLVDDGKLCSHQAIIFGVVCAFLGLRIAETMQMFMYNGLKTIAASLVRLSKLGAIEAQKWLYEFQNCLKDIIFRNQDVDPKDAALTFPTIDVLQMSHDKLFSKLFIS